MPKMTISYIVCKDWEWVEFGDWNHIASNKDWEWVEFGDWKIGDILHKKQITTRIKRKQKPK